MTSKPVTAKPLWRLPVNYAAVGSTQAADLLSYPPHGYRVVERRVRIGTGPARWDFAWHATLAWGIKIRSGFTVELTETPPEVSEGSYVPVAFDTGGTPVVPAVLGASGEDVYGVDGLPFVKPGDSAWLVFHFGPLRVREPVRVIYVIDEKRRKGFAYGTLPGHQLSGEEAFMVDTEPDGSVWLTVRTVSRIAPGWWWAAPVLRLGQRVVRGRYLKALSGPVD